MKPESGKHIVCKYGYSQFTAIVDTQEITNTNEKILLVRLSDESPVMELPLEMIEVFEACIACHGKGYKDLGGLEIECEKCNGRGY